MAYVSISPSLLQLRKSVIKVGLTSIQLRWRKPPSRKPKWLPTAPSKLYRIIEHPYVSPEEKKLRLDLYEEYCTKIGSLRIMFREELAQKNKDEGKTLENEKAEEAHFRLLLEENEKENKRMKIIRQEAMEKIFQENQLKYLELEEERKLKEQETKVEVDEIVRKEKIKAAQYITYSNLDEAVEKALDNPKNFNFTIDVLGNVNYEAIPPPDYEEEIKQRIAQNSEN